MSFSNGNGYSNLTNNKVIFQAKDDILNLKEWSDLKISNEAYLEMGNR